MQRKTIGSAIAAAGIVVAIVLVAMNPQVIDLFRGAVTGGTTDGTSTVAPDSKASYTAYLKVVGASQGTLKGGATIQSTVTARANWMDVAGYNERMDVPTDTATGQATGSRKHTTFDVVKPADLSSAQLAKALFNGEALTVTFEATQKTSNGTVWVAYRVELTDARLVSRSLGESVSIYNMPLEHLSFAFETITWTSYTVGGNSRTATDSWDTGVA